MNEQATTLIPTDGATAPDFELPDDNGVTRRLSERRGHWTVLYFYPKDDTPGCARLKRASSATQTPTIGEHDAEVWGVSVLGSGSKAAFKDKFGLPFVAPRRRGPRSRRAVRHCGSRSRTTAARTWASSAQRSWSIPRVASPAAGRRSSPRVTPRRSSKRSLRAGPRHPKVVPRSGHDEASPVGGDERCLGRSIQRTYAHATCTKGLDSCLKSGPDIRSNR